jgi:hypothetical protein
MDVLAYLQPLLPDAADPVVAIAGALQFEAGYTAARRGDNPGAWSYWDRASKTAERLPADYYDRCRKPQRLSAILAFQPGRSVPVSPKREGFGVLMTVS